MEPQLTLYRMDGMYSMVPHAVLTHFSIPFKSVPMRASSDDFTTGSRIVPADGSLTREEFLALVPTGFVPAIVVPSGEGATTSITELPAVLTYISSLVPDLNLLGDGPLERAKVAEWLAWLSGTVHACGFAAFFRPGRFTDDQNAFEVLKRCGKERIEKAFERIEASLSGQEFLVGNKLTMVDFNLYPFWVWATQCQFDLEKYPSFAKHMRKVEALDGVRKIVAIEGIQPCF